MTDERLMKLVGKRARQLRKAKSLTQEDMSRFGFEYRYYQRIEYGEKNLSLKTLNKFENEKANALVFFKPEYGSDVGMVQ
jgi:transcriptional regulator with XRE-family HTH domain